MLRNAHGRPDSYALQPFISMDVMASCDARTPLSAVQIFCLF
jgi:hypothetical protein